MLLRRTCLLIDYEDANKALEKAKPPKLEAVSIEYFLIQVFNE